MRRDLCGGPQCLHSTIICLMLAEHLKAAAPALDTFTSELDAHCHLHTLDAVPVTLCEASPRPCYVAMLENIESVT